MPLKKFQSAIASVDWAGNVDAFVSDTASAQRVVDANLRVAVWSRQFESSDAHNPALAFVREMQIASQHVAVLLALAMYKPAAASMRTMVETGMYYTYFRTHPTELSTLARAEGFYLERREILDFHKRHTVAFGELQQKLGVIARLEPWYGSVSATVHAQIPGKWVDHKGVAEIKPLKATQDVVVKAFSDGEEILHRFFLCTVARELWDRFSSTAKKQLLAGMSGDEKKSLELDVA